mmetsp:Transcript_33002/g.83781  ORF Transcript_33002/g.83781 Transcript_33002/m.83781 type:complete len:255 (+) Transcript_33002:1263-2027(+)
MSPPTCHMWSSVNTSHPYAPSPSGRVPMPLSTMCSATLAMSVRDTCAISWKGGNRKPCWMAAWGDMRDSSSAATRNMSSVMAVLLVSTAAWPTEGKMYALLACAGWYSTPLCVSGAKGEPDANTTRPSVQLNASSYVHSDLEVGLDRGKMMGRSFSAAISRTTSSEKALAMVDTPMRMVGLSALTDASRSGWNSTSCANGILWCCSSAMRLLHTRPRESRKKHCLRASSSGMPCFLCTALANSSPMPVPASPAP